MSDHHTGHCLCGAVRIRTSGALREVVACHCSQCRRQTGLYFAATNVRDTDLAIEGEESISWYRSSPIAQRAFCRICGSALFWKADGQDDTSIMAGLFDPPTALSIGRHIYCADKGDFYTIPDDVPHFAGNG